MKSILIAFIICLVAYQGNAQNDPKAKAFINEILAARFRSDSIGVERILNIKYNRPHYIYADSVGKMAIDMMREGMEGHKNGVFYIYRTDSIVHIDSVGKRTVIKKDFAFKNRKLEPILSDSLVITENEKAYINAEIDKMSSRTWKKNLLPGLTFVTADTLKQMDAKLTTSADHLYFQTRTIFNFGVPIFLRDDNYCFFYYDTNTGGDFSIYKKVNGKWIFWLSLYRWVT